MNRSVTAARHEYMSGTVSWWEGKFEKIQREKDRRKSYKAEV